MEVENTEVGAPVAAVAENAADVLKAKQRANLAKAREAAKAKRAAKSAAPPAIDAAKVGAAVAAAIVAATPAPAPKKEPEKRIKIVLEDSEEIGGDDGNKRQFFGHNGKTYLLRVGVEASVPEGLVNVLNDAVTSIPDKDPVTMKLNGRMRDRRRFNYRVVA